MSLCKLDVSVVLKVKANCRYVCCLSQPIIQWAGNQDCEFQQCAVWEKKSTLFPPSFFTGSFCQTLAPGWHTLQKMSCCFLLFLFSFCFGFCVWLVGCSTSTFTVLVVFLVFVFLPFWLFYLLRGQESQTNAVTRQHAFTERMFMNRFLTENPSKSTTKSKTE